jgi:hypothetical protein
MSSAIAEPPKLASVTTKSRALPNRLLLHAQQKWGKTSFAAQSPAPIFLCTRGEDGLDTLIKSGQLAPTEHYPEPVTTWNHLLIGIDELLIHEHPHKTFNLDTVNGAQQLAIEHVVQTQFKGDIESYDAYGRGIKFVVPEIIKLLTKLDQLRTQRNMAVILLAHSQVKTFNNPEGENYDRWEPVLEKQVYALLDRWVDMILFGNFETYLDKKRKTDAKAKASGGTARIIHTQRQAAFDAGNRYGLPPEIECGDNPAAAWKAFVTALHPTRK